MLTREEWHRRYSQQARWTLDIRRYLLNELRIDRAGRILEVGCGTGAVTAWLAGACSGRVFGIDLDWSKLDLAHSLDRRPMYAGADTLELPFSGRQFDFTVCHFFLLWIDEAEHAIQEMARVTRSGGFVAAFAEPDYGGRIDFPEELAEIGQAQAEALARQGADPRAGRKLASLLSGAGLAGVQTGVLGGQWSTAPSKEDQELEWSVLRDDLAVSIPPERLDALQKMDETAWRAGDRILFVPTFYGWGQVL